MTIEEILVVSTKARDLTRAAFLESKHRTISLYEAKTTAEELLESVRKYIMERQRIGK